MSEDIVRDTTQTERMTWGTCPVCHAKHGEKCDSSVGIPLGRTVSGMPPTDGVHLVRLQDAPLRVRMVRA